jgi:hypothetical protein
LLVDVVVILNRWYKPKHGADVHDDGAILLAFEMVEEGNGKVHRPSDVDVDFLIGFLEVEVVDV